MELKLDKICVGKALRVMRTNAGLTIHQLEKLTAIAATNVNRVEIGQRDLSFIEAHALCAACGKDLYFFQKLVEELQKRFTSLS